VTTEIDCPYAKGDLVETTYECTYFFRVKGKTVWSSGGQMDHPKHIKPGERLIFIRPKLDGFHPFVELKYNGMAVEVPFNSIVKSECPGCAMERHDGISQWHWRSELPQRCTGCVVLQTDGDWSPAPPEGYVALSDAELAAAEAEDREYQSCSECGQLTEDCQCDE
jgi:hypothetical protein